MNKIIMIVVSMGLVSQLHAGERHGVLHYVDSVLTHYYNRAKIDTTYVVRPNKKWAITGRLNFSGSELSTRGQDEGVRFETDVESNYKSTLSLGASYLGLSLNLSLNPAELLGHYKDFEFSMKAYGRRMGFDFVYQDAASYSGWHEIVGYGRGDFPSELLKLKTLNLNAYYAFNSRTFAYPAAFSHSYIQRRSAGSFLIAASIQGQNGNLKADLDYTFKMINFGIGGGYAYNYVPVRDWLLHISALPTFIVYSNTSFQYDNVKAPLAYKFPEVIITGRGGVVKQIGNHFVGASMVFTYSNIGSDNSLSVFNQKWKSWVYYGVRF